MKIYRVSQNYDDFKFLVYEEDGMSSKRALEFKGQTLTSNWQNLNFQIFVDPKKKKDERRNDFDASCYYPGILIINKEISNFFVEKFKGLIELLPVNVKSGGEFFFVNLLVIIDCINKDGKSNSEIMTMVRENRIVFKLINIDKYSLFRDNKLSSSYFCTEDFINFIETNKIKGLYFEHIGIAE